MNFCVMCHKWTLELPAVCNICGNSNLVSSTHTRAKVPSMGAPGSVRPTYKLDEPAAYVQYPLAFGRPMIGYNPFFWVEADQSESTDETLGKMKRRSKSIMTVYQPVNRDFTASFQLQKCDEFASHSSRAPF